MKGVFIGAGRSANTFCVRKTFYAEAGKAVLRATALGTYFAELNGSRVGDAYLAPGWTSYRNVLQVQEYEVELRRGENELTFTVNEGWYCGPLTWDHVAGIYGDCPAVCAELLIDGVCVVCTDKSWTAEESPIRASGIYDGERVDLTAELKGLELCEVSVDPARLAPQIGEPVRDIQRIPVRRAIVTPKGEHVYDFGQNISGVVELQTPPDFDGTIVMRFAELLVDGNFYTDNLRTAKATDAFTAKGAHTFCPEFTFHGFRYMKMEGAALPPEAVTAVVRHTDMRRTGYIETDDGRLSRLLENVVWSQRDNFVDIPTDCPQRDERMGWTGDLNVFCCTAAYNYDVRGVLRKWLRDLRADQAETGEVPHVVPDCIGQKHTDAMWCDAVTMVPYTLYEMYGDKSFLSENYGAMKKFVQARERTMENGLIVRGHEYGDWLAPDREEMLDNGPFGRTDAYYIVNVLHLHSLRILADTARILGDRAAEKEYRRRRRGLLARVRAEYVTRTGRLACDTVTAQALALMFGVVPGGARARLAAELNANVLRHGCRVATGFIGTPYLLFALADNGYFETAEKVLLNEAYPGWLYEVNMGATTIWERWNSLLPDGTPNPEGMNSYNHYAYGSVMEFVYRRVAGIEPLKPGFSAVRLAPVPLSGVGNVNAVFESPAGRIVSGYSHGEEKTVYRFCVPEGVKACIRLPGEQPFSATGGEYTFERPRI